MPKEPYKHDGEESSLWLEQVGDRLAWLRDAVEMSQTAIAEAVNVDQSSWAKYEGGKRMPPLHVMMRVATLFGASLDYIYRGKIGGVMRPDLELRIVAAHPELVLGAEQACPAKAKAPVA